MARGRLLVIANPGASRVERGLSAAVDVLFKAGYALDVRPSDDRDALRNLIAEEGKGADAILIGGGDGTVNGALPGLVAAGKPVGILPLGTANDLARTLGIPVDPAEAAAVVVAGKRRVIDVGRVNDIDFLNVASIGLSVDIAEEQDPDLKRQLGPLSYAVAALRALGRAAPFKATIEHDGRRDEVEVFQIAVGNGVHYGGGMRIAADAAIDDGLLDAYAVATASVTELIALAPAILDGSLGRHDKVLAFRAGALRVETAEPMPVNTDGEITTETPAAFSVARHALEVFAPA